jgi:hypothetical protein
MLVSPTDRQSEIRDDLVRDGVLHGEKGTAHEAGWLQIYGSLNSDGVADLYVDGHSIRLSRRSSIFDRPRRRSSSRRAALHGAVHSVDRAELGGRFIILMRED